MQKLILAFIIFIFILQAASPGMTLEENISFALKNNPSVLASQKKVEAAQAKLSQAVGAFFPTIKVNGDYGSTYTRPYTVEITTQTTGGAVSQDLSFGTDATAQVSGFSASLSQPLFAAALFPGMSIAGSNLDMSKEDLRKTVLDTAFNVTQAYFGVLKAQRFVELAKQSKEMAQSHLNQIKAMVFAGTSSRADQLRTEVQLANSEVALTKTLSALETAKDVFNNALGRDLKEEVVISENGLTVKIPNLPDYDQLIKLAFENRPDWKQFLLSKKMAEASLNLAKVDYLPLVMLNGQTSNRVTKYPSYNSDINSWSVSGAASWTLFDGLGRENRVREAAANLDAQKATEEQVKNAIILEVRQTFHDLTSAAETIGSTKKAVESAQENYTVSKLRYNSGAGTNLEEIDAQVILTQANANYVEAAFDLEIAKARINKVVGIGVF